MDLPVELKTLVIETLGLEDLVPDQIDAAAPLFRDGLGLDSIDALELGLAISKKYGVAMSEDSAENRQHFASISSLASFVAAHRTR